MLRLFGSLIIAVTPTYASIGIAAPAILALARIIEGLSLGGEYGASATYLSEVADPRHRGFYSSFQYVTLIGGQLTAIIVLLLLQKVFLTPEELKAWGWRIPFVIGALLAVFAAVMRRKLHETEAFVEAAKITKPTGSIRRLLDYPRELLHHRVAVRKERRREVKRERRIGVEIIPFDEIADRADEDRLDPTLHVGEIEMISPRLHSLFCHIRSPGMIQIQVAKLSARLAEQHRKLSRSAHGALRPGHLAGRIVKAELFPTNVRALGVGLPYAITVSLFGGTAPAVALYFKSLGHEDWFYYYLSGMICLSLIIYSTMRDTKHESAMHRHE